MVCCWTMQLSPETIADFHETVWAYYRKAARSMPWRDNPEPYWVLVSELMLQQTQVARVLPKFLTFIDTFPTIKALAKAPLSDVLRQWSGLGYNRRAKFLHQAAQAVVQDYAGVIPQTIEELVKLPGIGKNTAGAIMAYAFNQPVVFIETNIRSVYFYHFFADQEQIDDKELYDVVAATLDTEHPRQWYWALMDYGTFLKQTVGNNSTRSKHYAKQSTFAGSVRQLRGAVLRLLLDEGPRTAAALSVQLDNDQRLPTVIKQLADEGFVVVSGDLIKLTDHR